MDLECSGSFKYYNGKMPWRTVLLLAYQSFGVVYGDLSISPLYVYKSLFSGKVKLSDNDVEILGILSFIFWTFTLMPLVKYVLIVLRANDNGEGGTFALYSLLCRHANVSLLPNRQAMDEVLSTYKLEKQPESHRGSAAKRFLEKNQHLHSLLLITVLLATCMLIGDGLLTPAISVLSAVSGVKVAVKDLHEHMVVLIACVILVGVFALQHYGTCKVGFLFAPIVIAWLFCIGSIGVYNIIHWNPGVIKALSPISMIDFFKATGREGWIALGGVVLCITGTEAMYADLGHFSEASIRIAFLCVVYPCMILGYMGQAAFLSRNHTAIEGSFYLSIPEPVFWPVFIIATLASVVGSQAIISATFSIIKQCSSLGCFPRVKIVHTSKHIHGQIYIPEINWILMVLCLAVTIGYRDTVYIGHAYGLAVISVMLVTTVLMSLVMIVVWHKSAILTIAFLAFFGSIETFYIMASLIKVPEGGWLPLVLAMVFMVIMYSWHYGLRKKYEFDLQNKVSMKWLMTLGPSLGMVRVPGIGLIYTELVSGIPAVFSHFVTNLPAFHQFLVFVCVKYVHVPYVPPEERFLVSFVGPVGFHMYRCVVRYGYKDLPENDHDFETHLVLSVGEFIRSNIISSSDDNINNINERTSVMGMPAQSSVRIIDIEDNANDSNSMVASCSRHSHSDGIVEELDPPSLRKRKKVRFELPPDSPDSDPAIREKLLALLQAKEAGVCYILGHSYIKAKQGSSLMKKMAINVVYSFLRKNCRSPSVALNIPHICLIEVGMVYCV